MNDRQRRQAAGDVAWMIRQSGQTATIFRPQVAGEDSFFGPREASEIEIGSIPVEVKDLAPKDLDEIGADAVASVLPDSGVLEQDFLRIGATRYRVTEVKSQNLFGKITHLDLHLELEKREAAHG
jgi:hypothetical protein